MIRHALIIPVPGDPGGLLREGPCGSLPPTLFVLRCPLHGPQPYVHAGDGYLCPRCCAEANDGPVVTPYDLRALVLVWDGAVVPEGCDRACRANHKWGIHPWMLASDYALEGAIILARACESAGPGTAVIEEVPDAT